MNDRLRRALGLLHAMGLHGLLGLDIELRSGGHFHILALHEEAAHQTDRAQRECPHSGGTHGCRFHFQFFLCFRSEHGGNLFRIDGEYLIERDLQRAAPAEEFRTGHLRHHAAALSAAGQYKHAVLQHIFLHGEMDDIALHIHLGADLLIEGDLEYRICRQRHRHQLEMGIAVYRPFQLIHPHIERTGLAHAEYGGFQHFHPGFQRILLDLIGEIVFQRIHPRGQRRLGRALIADDIPVQIGDTAVQPLSLAGPAVDRFVHGADPFEEGALLHFPENDFIQFICLVGQRGGLCRRCGAHEQCRQTGCQYQFFHSLPRSGSQTRTSITADTPTPCTRLKLSGFLLSMGMSPLMRKSLSFQLISSWPTASTLAT